MPAAGDGGRRPREPYHSGAFVGGAATALAFNFSKVPEVVNYLRRDWSKRPVDFLFQEMIKATGGATRVYLPNLVQHTGRISSLKGKRQPHVSPTFVNGTC